eukprot:430284_1
MSKSGNHPWSLDPFETNFGIVVDDDNSSNCKTCVCRACCCFWFVFFWLIALFLVLVSCAAMRTLRITSKDFNAKIGSVLLTENKNITILHRGYIHEYQENTLGAITDAYARGMGAEFDISQTADHKYVLHHDYNEVENINYADIANHVLQITPNLIMDGPFHIHQRFHYYQKH